MKTALIIIILFAILGCGPVYDSHFITLPWISSHEYKAGDWTIYGPAKYESIQDHNKANQPYLSPLWWKLKP